MAGGLSKIWKLQKLNRILARFFLPTTSGQKRFSSTQQPLEKKETSLVGQNFLTLRDFSRNEVTKLLWTAADLKHRIKINGEDYRPLEGKSMAMLFQRRSTRTRLSAEIGIKLLGGNGYYLSPAASHFGVNESILDSAIVLSGFVDLILARLLDHSDLCTLAANSSVPVIEGCSDLYHPLQILADLLTLQEHYGSLKGCTLTWVGAGNHIQHSLMMGCPKMGMNLRVANPKGYGAKSHVIQDAAILANQHGTTIEYLNDPMEACYGTNVIVTSACLFKENEEKTTARNIAFQEFQVNNKMTSLASPDWCFLHCLPRKKSEVTDEVFYGPRSLVWREAENRKWTVMAVMLSQLMEPVMKIPKPNF